MMTNQFFYNTDLVYFNELSNRALSQSFNIINSFYNTIDLSVSENKNPFEYFEQRLKEILPAETLVELLENTIDNLPDRKWELNDYQIVYETFEKYYSKHEKKEELETLMREIFENQEEERYFILTYIQKVAIFANEQLPLWEDILVSDTNNKYQNFKIINEVILTLKSFVEINENINNKNNRRKWLWGALLHIGLKLFRIIQIMYLYGENKFDNIPTIAEFLREERFEMKYDLKLIS